MSLWDFYQALPNRLTLELLKISLRGVRIDLERRTAAIAEYEAKEKVATEALQSLVFGLDAHSPKQLMKLVYGQHKLKPVMRERKKANGTRERTPTLDEEAIKLVLAYENVPKLVSEALTWVLEIRAIHKILATYLRAPLDADGRLRCTYVIAGSKSEDFEGGTVTGRLSSRANPLGTGTNLQNVPPGIARAIVVPDPGMVFISADLAQAEARVVAYLAQEPRLMEICESGKDIFRLNAAMYFRCEPTAVTPEQRKFIKKVSHASNYGMGSARLAMEGSISVVEAARALDRYFATYTRIKRWQLETEETLRKTRILVTPLGRRREFFSAWSRDLVKEALAYVPQSTVGDLLNCGLLEYATGVPVALPCFSCVRAPFPRAVGEIVLQVHDSIIVQVPESQVAQAREELQRCLVKPLRINGRTCTIPIEIKQGASWDALH